MKKTAIGSTGIWGVSSIYAQQPTQNSSLIDKIASKFGLKKEDVQSVFDEHRAEMKDQMIARKSAHLDQLVKEGKITESQKQLILAKQQELQTSMKQRLEDMKNKTPAQRKEEMQKQKTELETWAKQNGIDIQYLFGGFGFKAGHMRWKTQ